jgi:C4-dicarboxylate-specific signal transduction histidine kinase
LRNAHEELETRVSQRTAELMAVNSELQIEIAQREQAQQDLQEM